MTASSWFGLLAGIGVGVLYSWLHIRSLQQRRQAVLQGSGHGKLLLGAIGRILLLVLALILVSKIRMLNKFWFVVGAAAGYGVPFLLQLKRMISQRK